MRLILQLRSSQGRVWCALKRAERKVEEALGLEVRLITKALKEELGAAPAREDVDRRIEGLLDDVLPDDASCTNRRARALFRLALVQELDLQPTKYPRRKRGSYKP